MKANINNEKARNVDTKAVNTCHGIPNTCHTKKPNVMMKYKIKSLEKVYLVYAYKELQN